MSRIGVIGAGAWGLALAAVAERAGHQVTIWARRAEAVEEINAKRMLSAGPPGIAFGKAVAATTAGALDGVVATLIIDQTGSAAAVWLASKAPIRASPILLIGSPMGGRHGVGRRRRRATGIRIPAGGGS